MPSIRPTKKIDENIREDRFETLAKLILAGSSKAALWIVAIATAISCLPVLWSILKWAVAMSNK